MKTFLTEETFSHLSDEGSQKILRLISQAGGEARFVGGAVRDTLSQKPVGDIDLATTLSPEHTQSCLRAAGVKVIPTGIDHGTVTAVIDGKPYEITTLRQDIETDGRHAKVSYTDAWETDAARRDFTINALYVDANGSLYDYFNGREDLQKHRIRFIGDAEKRIQEDILRILRYFRFCAQIGQGSIEKESAEFKACQKFSPLLLSLSAERVKKEIEKLLTAPHPIPSWEAMEEAGILHILFPPPQNIERLKRFLEIDKDGSGGFILRLSAVLSDTVVVAQEVAKRLRLSKNETERLLKQKEILQTESGRENFTERQNLHTLVYNYGKNETLGAFLVYMAGKGEDPKEGIKTITLWDVPVFPIKGTDLLRIGVMAGPRMGRILHQTEEWWIGQDFKPSRAECFAKAQDFLSAKR